MIFPIDVWDIIASHCSLFELVYLSSTCRRFWQRYHNVDFIAFWKNLSIREGFKEAVIRGNNDLVDLYIFKGANQFNTAMILSARHGHLHLVKKFVQLGATNWTWGLYESAKARQMYLLEYFAKKASFNIPLIIRMLKQEDQDYSMVIDSLKTL